MIKRITILFLFLLQHQIAQCNFHLRGSRRGRELARWGSYNGVYFKLASVADFSLLNGVHFSASSSEGMPSFTSLDSGDSMAYQTTLPTAGMYQAKLRISSPTGAGAFELRNQQDTDEVYAIFDSLPNSTDWETIEANITLRETETILQIVVIEGGWELLWMSLELVQAMEANNGTSSNSGNTGWSPVTNYVVNSEATLPLVLPPMSSTSKDNPIHATTNVPGHTLGNPDNMSTQDLNAFTISAEEYVSMQGISVEKGDDGLSIVTDLNSGDWIKYSVVVPSTGLYRMSLRVSSPDGDGEMDLTNDSDETVYATIPVPKTGSSWRTVVAMVNLPAGPQNLIVRVNKDGWTYSLMRFNRIVQSSENSGAPTLGGAVEENYPNSDSSGTSSDGDSAGPSGIKNPTSGGTSGTLGGGLSSTVYGTIGTNTMPNESSEVTETSMTSGGDSQNLEGTVSESTGENIDGSQGEIESETTMPDESTGLPAPENNDSSENNGEGQIEPDTTGALPDKSTGFPVPENTDSSGNNVEGGIVSKTTGALPDESSVLPVAENTDSSGNNNVEGGIVSDTTGALPGESSGLPAPENTDSSGKNIEGGIVSETTGTLPDESSGLPAPENIDSSGNNIEGGIESETTFSELDNAVPGNTSPPPYEFPTTDTITETEIIPSLENSLLEKCSATVEAAEYVSMEGVRAQESTAGFDYIGWLDPDDWVQYSVIIPSGGTYEVEFRVASPEGWGSFEVQDSSGAVVTTVSSIPATAEWQEWTTVTAEMSLSAGPFLMKIHIIDGGFNLAWICFTKVK